MEKIPFICTSDNASDNLHDVKKMIENKFYESIMTQLHMCLLGTVKFPSAMTFICQSCCGSAKHQVFASVTSRMIPLHGSQPQRHSSKADVSSVHPVFLMNQQE